MKYFWSNELNCVYTGDMQPGDREATAEEIEKHLTPPEVKAVRIFSKYRLWDVTSSMPFTLPDGTETTVWEAFKSFIKAAGKEDGYAAMNEIAEDNEYFLQLHPLAVESFGEDVVARVLEASVERIEYKTEGA